MTNVVVERDLECKLRDGTVLRADVYRPAESGRYPVLMVRTPYDRTMLHLLAPLLEPVEAASKGYVVIRQDVRSRFGSDGEAFSPLEHEDVDGYDAVQWAATLPYANGEVAVYGLSYMGATSWLAASSAPPALKTIVPAQGGDFFDTFYWRGGAVMWGAFTRWALWALGPDALSRLCEGAPDYAERFTALLEANDDYATWARHLPLQEFPPLRRDGEALLPYFFEVLEQGPRSDYSRARAVPRCYDTIEVPALIIAGWHDVLLGGDLEHYIRMRREAGSALAREQTKLVIGPWWHGMFRNVIGQTDTGFRALGTLDLTNEPPATSSLLGDFTWFQTRWFDHWMKGIDNGADEDAPVRLFVQGINRWRDEQEWPLRRAVDEEWYLGENATLGRTLPGVDEAPDSYVYDPQDPCPTAGGPLLMPDSYTKGPVDQRAIMKRPDVLSFVSAPVTSDLEVTGYVKAVLWAATSGLDTDWVVKLCDVHPDGRVLNVTDGILRARYRNGLESPELLEPGAVEQFEIDLWATSMVFREGHRIAVLVTSSDFPRYDRNLNTGELGVTSAEMTPARQRIFHDAHRASHVVLPVVR